MPRGPGKYDALATWARKRARAEGIILCVLGGEHGNGFSVQIRGPQTAEQIVDIARVLHQVADQIEADAHELRS
jgi:hypothetical protein